MKEKVLLGEEKKIRCVTALDLIKSLKQIKCQILLLTCAPISELPANTGTVTLPKRYKFVVYQCLRLNNGSINGYTEKNS